MTTPNNLMHIPKFNVLHFCKFYHIPEEYLQKCFNDITNGDGCSEKFRTFCSKFLLEHDTIETLMESYPNCYAWADDITSEILSEYQHDNDIQCNDKTSVEKESNDRKAYQAFENLVKINADYYDMNTGYLYMIQNYISAKRFGFPSDGIRVYQDNKYIGIIPEPKGFVLP